MWQVYTWYWDWYSPSIKLVLPPVPTRQALVQGWYYLKCLPSKYWYEASSLVVGSLIPWPVPVYMLGLQVPYKSNTGSVTVHTQSFFFPLFPSPPCCFFFLEGAVFGLPSALLLNSGQHSLQFLISLLSAVGNNNWYNNILMATGLIQESSYITWVQLFWHNRLELQT